MKLSDIEIEWVNDSVIKPENLGGEALKIPRLHSKYYGFLLNEKRLMHGLCYKKDELTLTLENYFAKTLTVEELVEFKLPPYSDKRVLKPDYPKYIQMFPTMVELNLKIATQSDKIEFLKDILKNIHGRSFIIKDAIEFQKFESGSY